MEGLWELWVEGIWFGYFSRALGRTPGVARQIQYKADVRGGGEGSGVVGL